MIGLILTALCLLALLAIATVIAASFNQRRSKPKPACQHVWGEVRRSRIGLNTLIDYECDHCPAKLASSYRGKPPAKHCLR